MLRLLSFLALFLISACASPSDTPLPVIRADDPVRPMVPDHLDYGQLPK
jgi:hypothetical protein